MEIETIPVGPFEVNCYLAWGAARRAIVIDPGEDADRILDALSARKLEVAAYLLTHGHADHVSALAEVCRRHPAPVAMHPDDARWSFTRTGAIPGAYPPPGKPQAEIRPLADGQEGTDGGMRWQVIATPGHTPGGVSLYFPDEGVLFSGDTLFQGSVGRTDLPGGSARTLSESLARLARLPDATRVFPGHGPATTIGEEKKTNFFLRGL
jgi:hydroxyacylglutathione hydrolase